MVRRLFVAGCLLGSTVAVVAAPSTARADRVYGAYIPEETRKIGEGRYQGTRDWDKILGKLASVYYNKNGAVWRQMPAAPGVRAVYIHNLRQDQPWEGINVYEHEEKVFIYVLRNPAYAPKKKAKKRKK